MVELCCNPYLAEETLGADRGCQLRPKHFERHLPFVLQVAGEVDHGHAAAAEFALDVVTIGETGFQPVESVGHYELRCIEGGKSAREMVR
jgi:hypothetical protein